MNEAIVNEVESITKRKKGNLSLNTSQPSLKLNRPRKLFQKIITPTIKRTGTINCELIYGILNLGFSSPASLAGSKSTPPHTSTNANRVPILVRSVTSVRFRKRAGTATTKPVRIVEKDGVLYLG
jgi:hypothetical protein